MYPTLRLRLIGAAFLLEGTGAFVLIAWAASALELGPASALILAPILMGILVVALIHVVVGAMCIVGTPIAWPTAIILNAGKLFFLSRLLSVVPFLVIISLALFPLVLLLAVLIFSAILPVSIYYLWTVRNTNYLAGFDSFIRDSEADPFACNLLTTVYSQRAFLLISALTRWAGLAICSFRFFSSDHAAFFKLNREHGRALVQVAREMTYLPGSELLAHDERPPVTYLRNFFNDGRKIDHIAFAPAHRHWGWLQGLANPLTALWALPLRWMFRSLRDNRSALKLTSLNLSESPAQLAQDEIALSEEEWLSSIFSLKGPFIAIGNPKEKEEKMLRDYGAARIYANNYDWQEKVLHMLRHSSLVVFKIDPEAEGWGADPDLESRRERQINWTWWEIATAAKEVPLNKVIFYLPFHRYKKDRRAYYQSVQQTMWRHTNIRFPGYFSSFIELDEQGNGYAVSPLSLLRRYYFAGKKPAVRHNPYALVEWAMIKLKNGFTHLLNAASWSALILSLPVLALELAERASTPRGFPVQRSREDSFFTVEVILALLVIHLMLTFFILIITFVISSYRSNR